MERIKPYRPQKWLDFGIQGMLVMREFNQTIASLLENQFLTQYKNLSEIEREELIKKANQALNENRSQSQIQ